MELESFVLNMPEVRSLEKNILAEHDVMLRLGMYLALTILAISLLYDEYDGHYLKNGKVKLPQANPDISRYNPRSRRIYIHREGGQVARHSHLSLARLERRVYFRPFGHKRWSMMASL